METTLESPVSIAGQELSVNESLFSQVRSAAQDVIPKILNLKYAYEALELQKPFSQELFSHLINGNGAAKAIEEFRSIAEKDAKMFKSPVAKNNLLSQVDESGRLLRKCVGEIQQSFEYIKSQTAYDLSTSDFSVNDNAVELLVDNIKEHYTTRITERQSEIYQHLEKLAEAYNEFVDYVKDEDFQTPFAGPMINNLNGRSLVDVFFHFNTLGKDWNGNDQLGPYVKVNKKSLTLFIKQ